MPPVDCCDRVLRCNRRSTRAILRSDICRLRPPALCSIPPLTVRFRNAIAPGVVQDTAVQNKEVYIGGNCVERLRELWTGFLPDPVAGGSAREVHPISSAPQKGSIALERGLFLSGRRQALKARRPGQRL